MTAAQPQPLSTGNSGRVEDSLLGFLTSRTRRSWAPDEDLFASGGMSSLFAMQLVLHVEQAFGITVAGDDLTLDNFRTVQAMAALVERARACAGEVVGLEGR